MKVDTFDPTDDDLRKVAALPFIEEWNRKGWINQNVPLFKERVSRASLSRDAHIADRVIRCTRISLYNLLEDVAFEDEDLWELYSNYVNTVTLRLWLYQNQNQDGLTEKLHDATVLVTFDGPKGAGKSKLAKAMARFVTSLDSSAEAEYHKSSRLADGMNAVLETYKRKEKKGEQLPISDLDMDGRLLLYNAALAKIGAEKPAYVFLDRSFITTLAKSWEVAEKNDRFIIDQLYHEYIEHFKLEKMEYALTDENLKKKLLLSGSRP